MSGAKKKSDEKKPDDSRRNFIQKSSLMVAGAAVGGQLSLARAAHPYGSETISIGLVGCGGRGTGAAGQAMNTEGPTRLIAACDAFSDKITASLRGLSSQHGDKVDVPAERQFAGLDGFNKLLETDVDLVILATPPGFRPQHFEAAVNAGKHVFMEKPVATDPAGVRRVLKAAKVAKEKNLMVQVGLQRRHERRYMETIKRLQDGEIGDINFTRAYWNGDRPWVRERKPHQNEMEYQMRNWYHFNWLCGDHIVEQHIHNLDVINWLKGAYPIEAQGQGGRQYYTAQKYGEIFDHHFVEFKYADGSVMLSQCRQIPGCWNHVNEYAHGSKGICKMMGRMHQITDPTGNEVVWTNRGPTGGHQQEHHDLFADIRKGKIVNEAEYGALSTMTAILGRMATYSGKLIKWEDAISSDVVIAPTDEIKSYEDAPPTLPNEEGDYNIPIPGATKVV